MGKWPTSGRCRFPARQPIGAPWDQAVRFSTVADALVAPPRLLDPDPVIDPALGIVVTECFNAAGDLTSRYPTRQMLDADTLNGFPGSSDDTATAGTADRPA